MENALLLSVAVVVVQTLYFNKTGTTSVHITILGCVFKLSNTACSKPSLNEKHINMQIIVVNMVYD